MRIRVEVEYEYTVNDSNRLQQALAWANHLDHVGLPVPALPGLVAGTANAVLVKLVEVED